MEDETTRERIIRVKLSDEDCEKLCRMCGERGLTVGGLIEDFIGDLIDGVCTNGSDERRLINTWFCRCHFYQNQTLLNHLLFWEHDPEEYLNILNGIEAAKSRKKYLEEHPEESDEEAPYIDDEIKELEFSLEARLACWKSEKELDMDKELEIIKKWVQDRKNLIEAKICAAPDCSVNDGNECPAWEGCAGYEPGGE